MSSPIFPEGYGSGTDVSPAHIDILQRIQDEVDRLDARIDGISGGEGIFPAGVLRLPELTDPETILTSTQVLTNGRIFAYSNTPPIEAIITSNDAGPGWDLSTKSYLRLNRDGPTPGPFEFDLYSSLPDPSTVLPDDLAGAINLTFGAEGFSAAAQATNVTVAPGGSATQIRAEIATGGGGGKDANDIVGFEETWQVGSPARILTIPTLTDADGQPLIIIAVEGSQLFQIKQTGGLLITEISAIAGTSIKAFLIWDEVAGTWAQ